MNDDGQKLINDDFGNFNEDADVVTLQTVPKGHTDYFEKEHPFSLLFLESPQTEKMYSMKNKEYSVFRMFLSPPSTRKFTDVSSSSSVFAACCLLPRECQKLAILFTNFTHRS